MKLHKLIDNTIEKLNIKKSFLCFESYNWPVCERLIFGKCKSKLNIVLADNLSYMEIDILKETINVLKKDPGIDQTALNNREKAVIIDALKSKYSLPKLINKRIYQKVVTTIRKKHSLNRINIFHCGYV